MSTYPHMSPRREVLKSLPKLAVRLTLFICFVAWGKWYSSTQEHNSIISPGKSSFQSLWRSGNEIKYLVVWLLLFSRILGLCVPQVKKYHCCLSFIKRVKKLLEKYYCKTCTSVLDFSSASCFAEYTIRCYSKPLILCSQYRLQRNWQCFESFI